MHPFSFTRRITAAWFLFALTLTVQAYGAPALLSYQGFVTDDQDVPLDGPANLEFALFATATGGTALWTEAHAGVPVTDGIFHAVLGSVTALDPALFDSNDRWLESRVEGVPLVPRRALHSVPYALRAAVADVALSGGSGDDWENNGADVYRGTGNVGIGTSAPAEPLHIVDPLFARVQLDRAGGSSVRVDAALSSGSVGTSNATPFRLTSNNSVRLTVDTDGEIGVGTTTPDGRLDVRGDGTQDVLNLSDGGTNVLSVTGDGLVGIRDATPMNTLSVGGAADAEHFEATTAAGASATPAVGGVYSDNVVYAWGRIRGDGVIEQSYGIESVNWLGTGFYRVNFKRTLPNGVVPVVIAYSANDIVVARVAAATSTSCDMRLDLWVPGDGQFSAIDYRFLVQVVGRP